MAKTINDLAVAYGKEHQGTVDIEVFEAGANAVLEKVETYIQNLDLGNSAEEKFYKLDAIADVGLYIKQLKGEEV